MHTSQGPLTRLVVAAQHLVQIAILVVLPIAKYGEKVQNKA